MKYKYEVWSMKYEQQEEATCALSPQDCKASGVGPSIWDGRNKIYLHFEISVVKVVIEDCRGSDKNIVSKLGLDFGNNFKVGHNGTMILMQWP